MKAKIVKLKYIPVSFYRISKRSVKTNIQICNSNFADKYFTCGDDSHAVKALVSSFPLVLLSRKIEQQLNPQIWSDEKLFAKSPVLALTRWPLALKIAKIQFHVD